MTKNKTRMLTAEEERALIDAYLDNKDISARNKLMIAYMPLATRAAEAFASRGTSQLSDLVQEGAVALSQAIDNFKRDKDARLSTLARYYIKAALMRHAMDFHGVVRIGTNLPDKKVFMNLRRMVADIQSKNGGEPITDADRQTIATELGVRVDAVKRMEPRVFSSDMAVVHTDARSDGDGDETMRAGNVLAVEGEQPGVEAEMDQRDLMRRIYNIVETNFEDRDLEIVQARLSGDMTRKKYDELVTKHGISVERIRQIQRGALAVIRDHLQRDGITGMDAIAL